MPTEKTKESEKDLLDDATQAEDDRVAAEEASEVAGEDEAVVRDAQEERVP